MGAALRQQQAWGRANLPDHQPWRWICLFLRKGQFSLNLGYRWPTPSTKAHFPDPAASSIAEACKRCTSNAHLINPPANSYTDLNTFNRFAVEHKAGKPVVMHRDEITAAITGQPMAGAFKATYYDGFRTSFKHCLRPYHPEEDPTHQRAQTAPMDRSRRRRRRRQIKKESAQEPPERLARTQSRGGVPLYMVAAATKNRRHAQKQKRSSTSHGSRGQVFDELRQSLASDEASDWHRGDLSKSGYASGAPRPTHRRSTGRRVPSVASSVRTIPPDLH